MATLAQAHSYSFPILVIGLTHEATSPPTVDVSGHFRVFSLAAPFITLAHAYSTNANGASPIPPRSPTRARQNRDSVDGSGCLFFFFLFFC